MILEPPSAPQPREKSWQRYGPALWLLLILALVAFVRLRLLSLPLERDEGEYAYAGQLMLEGEPPYKLIYNMKMPGIYAAYALIMAVFGQTPSGIHAGFILVNFGAILLIYFVGRRFLEAGAAVIASGVYAVLSLSPNVQGLNAHATHFVVLAALGGILVLLRALENGRLAGFFWSGVLFGLAFLMKQPGGALAIFGFSLLVWNAWRQQPIDWKMNGLRLALYSFGVAAPIILTGLILWRAGVWDRFWWWTVTYAGTHATARSFSDGMTRLGSYIKSVHWDWSFWILAALGIGFVLIEKTRAGVKFFFLAFFFFSVAAVCPTWHFTGHYFVLAQPAVALLAARAWAGAMAKLTSQSRAFLRQIPSLSLGLLFFADIQSHGEVFFEWEPDEAVKRIYPSNDFQVYPVIADFMRSQSPPSATLAVIGSEPELLFYAHRRSVTGYIYMYDLVQPQPFRERMEIEMISEIEKGRPDYIVFVNLVFSWTPYSGAYVQEIQNWMTHYTDSYYEPFGVVTFPPNQYCFKPDCLELIPPGHRFITIFHRKPLGHSNNKLY